MKTSSYIITLIIALLSLVTTAQVAQQRPDLLQRAASQIDLDSLCAQAYAPYAPYTNRTFWESMPEAVRAEAIAEAEAALGYVWRSVTLTSYLDFTRNGIRQPNDQHIGERHSTLGKLLLGELIEGKGRFIDAIANGVWSLCEQSTWVATAHISLQGSGSIPDIERRAIDLSAGETANTLAWTLYFMEDELTKLSPTLTKRLRSELQRHILDTYLERDDLWWMATGGGFVNNWNPWCNFNVLTTALLTERDPARRTAILSKSLRSVDQFINYFKPDGCCEEGPAYWGHAGGKLLEYLELLNNYSGGKINVFDNERVKNIGLYIARAHIDSLYYVNFADAGARNHPLPDITYRYGAAISDRDMMEFGAYNATLGSFATAPLRSGSSFDTRLNIATLYDSLLATTPRAPMYRSVWMDGTEVAVGRTTEGSSRGLLLAVKGGHNAESHNHNDVGTFILYVDGQPMIVDAGVGTYTAKTFSDRRYDIWTMQSEYHNLPVINGYGQRDGASYRSRNVRHTDNGRTMAFELDIAGAYPEQAACRTWQRSYIFDRQRGRVRITDSYTLDKIEGATVQHLLTCATVDSSASERGSLTLEHSGNRVRIDFDPAAYTFGCEQITIDDPRLSGVWGERLTRLRFTTKKPTLKSTNSITITQLR